METLTYIEDLLIKVLVVGTVFSVVLAIFSMRQLKKSRKDVEGDP